MKLDHVYDHHNGVGQWERCELHAWLTGIFDAPAIKMGDGCTSEVRDHVRAELERQGWAVNVKIDQGLGLSVLAIKDKFAVHLQTGNISRAAYDLLKLQYLYSSNRIQAAALAVPTKDCAVSIGSNIANAERITKELQLFDCIVTVPIALIAFK